MKLLEYTKSRAESIPRLDFSKTQLPFNVRWMEIVNSEDRLNTIFIGNHSHSFYEIHYVFSGCISYNVNNIIQTVYEGEALLIPPNTPHRYLQNSTDFIKSSLAFAVNDEYAFQLANCKKFKFDYLITENTDYILKKAENTTFFSSALIGGRIAEILESSLLSLDFTIISNENSKDTRINIAVSFIDKNVHRQIKSKDVSNECCLSIKQLNRIFLKELNMSIHDYIINSKINFAQILINNSDYSFKEIAFKLGFSSESNFTIFFKRHTGKAPKEYRTENPL